MTRFIDEHREQFGVTPICDLLGWNVSTYYAYKRRPPSELALRDEYLMAEIRRVWEANYRVYGYLKILDHPHSQHPFSTTSPDDPRDLGSGEAGPLQRHAGTKAPPANQRSKSGFRARSTISTSRPQASRW